MTKNLQTSANFKNKNCQIFHSKLRKFQLKLKISSKLWVKSWQNSTWYWHKNFFHLSTPQNFTSKIKKTSVPIFLALSFTKTFTIEFKSSSSLKIINLQFDLWIAARNSRKRLQINPRKLISRKFIEKFSNKNVREVKNSDKNRVENLKIAILIHEIKNVTTIFEFLILKS